MEDQNLSYKSLLSQKGFPSYLWTEFLSALTDNLYKMTLTFLVVHLAIDGLSQANKISIIGAVFLLPLLIFSGWGGYFADKFPKRNVLMYAKMGEFFALILACGALHSKDFLLTMVTLFILLIKSAILAPSKYGIIPEITSPHQISRANGLVQMSTFVAIIMGTVLAGMFSTVWGADTVPISVLLILLGAGGWWISRSIPYTMPSSSVDKFPLNPWGSIGEGFKKLKISKSLRISYCGSFWFWMTASICQVNLFILGKENLIITDFLQIEYFFNTFFDYQIVSISDFYVALLQTFLAVGIGYGSGMAGFLSGDKIELGLMPLGVLGISSASIYLSYAAPSYIHAVISLTMMGFFCGFFMVPLNSFIQSRANNAERGRLMATQSFLDTCGMLSGVALYFILSGPLNFSSPAIFMIVGILTLLVGFYIIKLMPIFLIRFVLWVLIHTFYRIRVVGRENVPLNGPTLLVANHVSYIDGLLISACVSKNIRFLVYGAFFNIRAFSWLFQKLKIIPVRSGRDLTKSIERARSGLLKNEIVGIFAEGELTRTGNMLPFKRGFEKIMEELPKDIPIVPIYLDGLWWSIFSFEKGKFFFKMPSWRKLDITVCFGEHLPAQTKSWELRQTISELSTKAALGRRKNDIPLGMQLIQIGRLHWFKDILGDWGRKSLSYGRLIIRSLTLASYFRKNITADKVGVYLEDNLQKAVVNIALNFAGKVVVNLDINEPISLVKTKLEIGGVSTVISTRMYAGDHFRNPLLLEKIPKVRSKIKSLIHAGIFLILPSRLSFRLLCDYDSVATTPVAMIFDKDLNPLIFTHSNILAQTQSLGHIFFNNKNDLLLASLPLNTIDGLILGLWFPLFSELPVVYGNQDHITGEHIQESQVTFLITNSNNYRGLFEQAKPFHLASLRYPVVLDGGMNQLDLENYKLKFGLELLEGYSIPELCGFISLNHKSYIIGGVRQIAQKDGTVGQAIPGTCAAILDPDTFEALIPGEKGVLFFKSPGRAQNALKNGQQWYNTKLSATMDEAGFIILDKGIKND